MSFDEERAGRTLRTGLLHIEPPASGVEVERIVRAGRRAERRARIATAVGGAALAVAVGVPVAVAAVRGGHPESGPAQRPVVSATKSADCTVSPLNRSGPGGELQDADPTGRILLGINGSSLVRWRDGVSEVIATSDIGGVLMPAAVNSAGVVVGTYVAVAQPQPTGWILRGGALTPLALPAGARTATPMAINEAGDVVGAMMPESLASQSVLVVWPAASPGSPRLIEPDVAAVPVGITADGSVVGTVLGYAGRQETVAVWGPDGARRDLPVPAGFIKASATVVRGDTVYGTAAKDGPVSPRSHDDLVLPSEKQPTEGTDPDFVDPRSPVRWNLRDGRSTVYPVTGALIAAASTGWILAGTLDSFEGRIAAVSPDGTRYELPAPKGTVGAVLGRWISDDGRAVAGAALVTPGGFTPFTWTCAYR
jgi:hypothetical protein